MLFKQNRLLWPESSPTTLLARKNNCQAEYVDYVLILVKLQYLLSIKHWNIFFQKHDAQLHSNVQSSSEQIDNEVLINLVNGAVGSIMTRLQSM
jgi:hypothetical protein